MMLAAAHEYFGKKEQGVYALLASFRPYDHRV